MTALLDLDGVHKDHGRGKGRVHALLDISLRIGLGEVCAVTGASGSGKSTLLSIMGLLDRPDRGRILFDGVDVGNASADRLARLRGHRIGFVFQAFNLLPRLSVLENVTLPFLYRGRPPSACRGPAMAALDRVGLADRATSRPEELSGGQRQRVAIARAIAGDPPLLLADEPTGNLDSEAARRIVELFFALNVDTGVTVVMVTHDPSIAARCPRRILVQDGRLRAGSPAVAP